MFKISSENNIAVFSATLIVSLAGMTKVEEKLKAGRVKRTEGGGLSEESQKRPTTSLSKKDPATTSSGRMFTSFCIMFGKIDLLIFNN